MSKKSYYMNKEFEKAVKLIAEECMIFVYLSYINIDCGVIEVEVQENDNKVFWSTFYPIGKKIFDAIDHEPLLFNLYDLGE